MGAFGKKAHVRSICGDPSLLQGDDLSVGSLENYTALPAQLQTILNDVDWFVWKLFPDNMTDIVSVTTGLRVMRGTWSKTINRIDEQCECKCFVHVVHSNHSLLNKKSMNLRFSIMEVG